MECSGRHFKSVKSFKSFKSFKSWFFAVVVFLTIIRWPTGTSIIHFKFTPMAYVSLVLLLIMSSFFISRFKINIFIRLFFINLILNSFLSRHPGYTFITSTALILMGYWFVMLSKSEEEEFDLLLKIYPIMFFLQLLFICLQLADMDFLLNPTRPGDNTPFGTIGQMMRLASFTACLLPLLVFKKRALIKCLYVILSLFIVFVTESSGGILAILGGVGFYLFVKIRENIFSDRLKNIVSVLMIVSIISVSVWYLERDGRFQCPYRSNERFHCWLRAVQITNNRPWYGNGYRTFAIVYPLNSEDLMVGKDCEEWTIGDKKGDWLRWGEAHNDYVELYWDFGLVGLMLGFCFIGSLIYYYIRSIKSDELLVLTSGLICVGIDMFVHFPTKMMCINFPIIIPLLALFYIYVKKGLDNETFDFDSLTLFGIRLFGNSEEK